MGKEFGKYALDTCVLFDALREWDADDFCSSRLNLKLYTAEGGANQPGSQNVVYPSRQYSCTMLNGKYQCGRKLRVSHPRATAHALILGGWNHATKDGFESAIIVNALYLRLHPTMSLGLSFDFNVDSRQENYATDYVIPKEIEVTIFCLSSNVLFEPTGKLAATAVERRLPHERRRIRHFYNSISFLGHATLYV